MAKHDNGAGPVRLDPAAIATFEDQLRRSGLSRRALMQRGLALGLAAAGPRFASAAEAKAGEKGGGGTLIVTVASDPLSFNPDFQVDDAGYAPCCNIYNTLMSLDGQYGIIPELATAWEVAADGLSIRFSLAAGAAWHDGTPVTSRDVKYTFETIVARKGAPAAGLLGAIAAVETPDAATALVRLKQPSASILGFIAWYGTFILPAHLYEGTAWDANPAIRAPVGSGPFRFARHDPGLSIELEANPAYFGEGPFVDRLVFRIIPDANTALQALLNGEVDVVFEPTPPASQVPALEQTEGIRIARKQFPTVYTAGFNMEKEPTSKPAVRRALAQAIDRQPILDTALGGYGAAATAFYTSAIPWASNTRAEAQAPAFDRAAAAAALDAAGYPVTDGRRFALTLVYFTVAPEYGDIATVLKQQFKQIDVEVELVGLEIGAGDARMRSGDFDIGLISGFQGPDPANLRIRVGKGGGVNYWRYLNADVERLLDQGDTLSDQAARAEKYFEMQAILARDLPIVPLANVIVNYPYTDRVSGLWFDNSDPAAMRQGLNRFGLARIAK